MKLRFVFLAAMVAAAGCSSMSVNHDYDRQADFSGYSTYEWRDGDANVADTDPLAHERFVNAVNGQLRSHGFSEVSSNPDVVMTYHAEESEEMSLDTTYMGGGWGYGPGWRWGGYYGGIGGMGASTTTVRKYNTGTVVLDMWDAKEKRLVWRGIVSDVVSDNPQKNAGKIMKAAQELFKGYPPEGN